MSLSAAELRPDTYSFTGALQMLHLGLGVRRHGWRADAHLKILGGELNTVRAGLEPCMCVLAGDSILADDWCTYTSPK